MKKNRALLSVVSICLLAQIGCGGSEGPMGPAGPEGPAPQVSIVSEPAGDNCEAGGIKVSVGDEDPIYVCDGQDGTPGQNGQDGAPGQNGQDGAPGQNGQDGVSPTVSVEPIGEDEETDCENGGVKVIVDLDDGSDPTVEHVCHGTDGKDGKDGKDGTDGVAPTVTVEPIAQGASTPCGTRGGIKVTINPNTGAATTTEFVCNGATGPTGEPGQDGLYAVSVESFGAGENSECPAGGLELTLTTLDDDDQPVSTVHYVCNGQGGEGGDPGTDPNPDPDTVTIGWCNLQHPVTITLGDGEQETVYGRLFVDGVTGSQSTERPAYLKAELGYGPRDSDPATSGDWTWIGAERNTEFTAQANNDEYQATLNGSTINGGEYDYAYRFSGDDGQSWSYCDITGLDTGYSAADAGKLTVVKPSTITMWDFDDTDNRLAPAVGTGTASHSSGNAGTYPNGRGGQAWSQTNWSTSTTFDIATTPYFQFETSLTGYGNITFSFEAMASGTGVKTFAVAYSIGGGDWTVVADDEDVSQTTTWHSASFNLSEFAPSVDNQAEVTVRVYGFDAGANTGTWRIDNVTFSGVGLL